MGLGSSRARAPATCERIGEQRVRCPDVTPDVVRALSRQPPRRVVVDCRRGPFDEGAVAALAGAVGGAHRLVFEL